MSVLELIPNCKHDMEGKCKVCAQTKITKTPFPKIERKTSLLEFVLVMYVIYIVHLVEQGNDFY